MNLNFPQCVASSNKDETSVDNADYEPLQGKIIKTQIC